MQRQLVNRPLRRLKVPLGARLPGSFRLPAFFQNQFKQAFRNINNACVVLSFAVAESAVFPLTVFDQPVSQLRAQLQRFRAVQRGAEIRHQTDHAGGVLNSAGMHRRAALFNVEAQRHQFADLLKIRRTVKIQIMKDRRRAGKQTIPAFAMRSHFLRLTQRLTRRFFYNRPPWMDKLHPGFALMLPVRDCQTKFTGLIRFQPHCIHARLFQQTRHRPAFSHQRRFGPGQQFKFQRTSAFRAPALTRKNRYALFRQPRWHSLFRSQLRDFNPPPACFPRLKRLRLRMPVRQLPALQKVQTERHDPMSAVREKPVVVKMPAGDRVRAVNPKPPA